jgi:hypothetical protein
MEFTPLFKPIGVLFGSFIDSKSMFSRVEFIDPLFHFFHPIFDIKVTGSADNI